MKLPRATSPEDEELSVARTVLEGGGGGAGTGRGEAALHQQW